MTDNEEGQSLNKYEDEDEEEDVRYVSLPFVTLAPPRKELNRSIDIGKGTKSLNKLVYILKTGLSYNY